MNFVRYFVLSAVYMITFSAAWIMMEIVEGNKISGTDYASVANYGFPLIFLIVCLVIASTIVALPLTILVDRLLKQGWLRIVLLSGLSVMVGAWLYKVEYQDYAEAYDLRMSTACLLFGLAGLIYSLVNEMLKRSQQRIQAHKRDEAV